MNQIYMQKVGLRERAVFFNLNRAVEVQPVLNFEQLAR